MPLCTSEKIRKRKMAKHHISAQGSTSGESGKRVRDSSSLQHRNETGDHYTGANLCKEAGARRRDGRQHASLYAKRGDVRKPAPSA